MNTRGHLKRLPPEHYRGGAIVHWTMTILSRRKGWLSVPFYYRFRELMAHTAFRYGTACPVFSLMPDHFHLIWMGLFDWSDQLFAMKHLRKTTNESLQRIGYELQDQAFDHVLDDDERIGQAFHDICNYVARNPERAGLVEVDGYGRYPFSGCVVPGYPQLRPFESGFWDQFDREISYLKREGLFRHSHK